MSGWRRPKPDDPLLRIGRLERGEGRGRSFAADYDPDDRPERLTGVEQEFRVREKRGEPRYKNIVTFDLFTKNTCQADVFYYIVQMQATNKNGVPLPGRPIEQEIVQAQDLEDRDDDNDDPRAVFKPIDHPRTVYRRVRACVVDKGRRKGKWGGSPLDGSGEPINAGGWSDPVLPVQDARPVPPYPDNRSLTFDKEEAGRDEARYRAKVKFDEINFWDVPPTADRDKITGTLSGAIDANDTTVTLSSAASWPAPLPKERIPFSIRPFHEDTVEVASYGDKAGNNLLDVRRGLEGTTARAHPDNANVRISAADAQDRQNDIKAYEVQIRRCTVDEEGDFVAWVRDSEDAFVQRDKRKPWKAEDHDENDVVRAIFPNVRKRHWWRARVRTIAEYGLKSDWSPWTDPDSPSDPEPPVPTNVTAIRGIDKVGLEWNSPGDDDDPDLISEEVGYYQVQAIREPDGAGWDGADAIAAWAAIDAEVGQDAWDACWKYDKYVHTTHKKFHAEQYDQKHHLRVRSVRHREKSPWRYGVKENETELYEEDESPGSFVRPRASRETETFTYGGTLTAKETEPWLPVDGNFEIRKVVATIGTAPTGQSIKVQMKRRVGGVGGTVENLFSTDSPDNRLDIGLDGQRSVRTQEDMEFTTIEDGDDIRLNVGRVGNGGEPGKTLTVRLYMRKIED